MTPRSAAASTVTSPARPRGFQGEFRTDLPARRACGQASGPFRLVPMAVARPLHADDVATLVRVAGREGWPLVPRGAGTGMPGHNVGRGVVVDLSGLDHVHPPDRDRGTVRVGAGAIAAHVDRRAAECDLWLPCMPSSAERCTVGGMVANNAAGARSFGHGAIHAWVEGLEVVTSDGEAHELAAGDVLPPPWDGLRHLLPEGTPTWPDVRKNSSGYALDRFHAGGSAVDLIVGSEGTLALVTSVTLRLRPRPEARRVVLLGLPDVDALPGAVAHATSAGASACEFFGRRIVEMAGLSTHRETASIARDAAGLVLLEFEGTEDEVCAGAEAAVRFAGDRGTGSLEAAEAGARQRLWDLRHRASPTIARAAARGLRSMQFVEDCVVPVPALPAWLRGLDGILDRAATDAVVFGHAGDGNLHVNPLVDTSTAGWRDRVRTILEDVTDLVADLGGTLSGEHGDGRVRAPYLERVWGRALARSFRIVKDHLDPKGILNPGVVVPLADQDPLDGLRVPPLPH